MRNEFYITASVKIKNNEIFKNDQSVFKTNKELSLLDFLKEAYQFLDLSYAKFHKMDVLCKLGVIATTVLKEDYPSDAALVFQNKSSSEMSDFQHQEKLNDFPSPANFVYTLPNIVMGEISIKHQLQSENAFFIAEEFQPQIIVSHTESLLKNNKASATICGWLEANLNDYYVFLNYIEPQGEVVFSAPALLENYIHE